MTTDRQIKIVLTSMLMKLEMMADNQIRHGSNGFNVLSVFGLSYLLFIKEVDALRIDALNRLTQNLNPFETIEYYHDTKNGLRFESESVALLYLETGEVPNEDAVSKIIWIIPEPEPSTNVACIDEDTQVSVDKDTQANEHSLDWLPGDWEVDYATGKNGITEQYYIEPTSGFKFRSKEDVLCYLEYEDSEASTSSEDSLASHSSKRKGTNLKKRARSSGKAARDTERQKGTNLKKLARSRGNVRGKNVRPADDMGCSSQYTERYIEPTQGRQFGQEEASTSKEPVPICIALDSSKCKGTPLKKRARSRSNDVLRFQESNVDQSLGRIPSSWGVRVGIQRRGRKRRDAGITNLMHFNGRYTPRLLSTRASRRLKGLDPELQPQTRRTCEQSTHLGEQLVEAHDHGASEEQPVEPVSEYVDSSGKALECQGAPEQTQIPTTIPEPTIVQEVTEVHARDQEEHMTAELQGLCVGLAVMTLTGEDPVPGETSRAVEDHQHQHASPEERHFRLPDLNEPVDEHFVD